VRLPPEIVSSPFQLHKNMDSKTSMTVPENVALVVERVEYEWSTSGCGSWRPVRSSRIRLRALSDFKSDFGDQDVVVLPENAASKAVMFEDFSLKSVPQ